MTSNDVGVQVGAMHYMPFGDQWYADGVVATDYRFTGQRLEVGLGGGAGLYDYGARWYDPSLARFVQPDTVAPNTANPQGLNRYTSVLNNPIRYNDPTGHCIPGVDCPYTIDETGGPVPPWREEVQVEVSGWTAGAYIEGADEPPVAAPVVSTTIDTTCLVASATATVIELIGAVSGQAWVVNAVEGAYAGINFVENIASWGSTAVTTMGDNAAGNNYLEVNASGIEYSEGQDTLVSTVLSALGQYVGTSPATDTVINAAQVIYDFATSSGSWPVYKFGFYVHTPK